MGTAAGSNPLEATPLTGSSTSPSGDVLTLPANFFNVAVPSGTSYQVTNPNPNSNPNPTPTPTPNPNPNLLPGQVQCDHQ